jgi:hypothetical protein
VTASAVGSRVRERGWRSGPTSQCRLTHTPVGPCIGGEKGFGPGLALGLGRFGSPLFLFFFSYFYFFPISIFCITICIINLNVNTAAQKTT